MGNSCEMNWEDTTTMGLSHLHSAKYMKYAIRAEIGAGIRDGMTSEI